MSDNVTKKPIYLQSICNGIAKNMQDYVILGGDEQYDCKDYDLPEPEIASDVTFVLGYLKGYRAKCETTKIRDLLSEYIKQLTMYSNAIMDVE